jgi:putative transposase
MNMQLLVSRGYLPHLPVAEVAQFVTWRLNDSIPNHLWDEWRKIQVAEDPAKRQALHHLMERHLDAGHGEAYLREPGLARIVMESILAHHGEEAFVLAAVVMPNHVHMVVWLSQDAKLREVVRKIKGLSAKKINEELGRSGRFWQPDYFDRLIRSPDHLEKCVRYVHWNPVKAKLASDPRWYPFSTAYEDYARRLRTDTGLRS